ncbi:MAG: response regulator [Ottowia sp.]|nr:response regulator [Ottowia sp.]
MRHKNDRDTPIINRLLEAVKDLERQMRDLADYAKLDSDVLELKKEIFKPSDLIANVVVDGCVRAKEKGLSILVDLPGKHESIFSDPHRIKQIVENLLSNAIKYTERGYISLKVVIRRDVRQLEISVEDTGTGIADKDIGKIFEPFTQLDQSITRKYSGVGMGLAIVRNLVDRMGGSINATSKIAVGTKLDVRIPIEICSHHKSKTIKNEPDIFRSLPRILVVDDHDDIQEVFRAMLEQLGLACDVVGSADAALNKLLHTRYDALLFDINMPDKDGLSMLAELRRTSCINQHIHAIAISAYQEKISERWNSLAISNFLVKPVRYEVLQDAIHALLP